MDPTAATDIMNDIMSIPLVAQAISISVTLGLASGGFFVAWNIVRKPFDVIRTQIYRNLTRNLQQHSDSSPYYWAEAWLKDNNHILIFNRNFQARLNTTYNNDTGERESTVRMVAGYGSSFFYKKRFGLVKVTRSKVEGNQTAQEVQELNYVFYTKNEAKVKCFLDETHDYYIKMRNAEDSGRSVYNDTSYIGQVKKVLPPLAPDATEVIQDIEKFIDNETFYRKRGIPYKRGYMLYGPPGTGKTSLAAYAATKFGLDVVTTNGMKDLEVRDRPYILLIEDIDLTGLASKRNDLVNSAMVESQAAPTNNTNSPSTSGDDMMQEFGAESLRSFLNQVDGITETHGMIIIITSNKPDVLDPALIRPGRIDVKAFLDNYDTKTQIEHFNRFYETSKKFSGELKPISCAALQNICISSPHDPDEAWEKIIKNEV